MGNPSWTDGTANWTSDNWSTGVPPVSGDDVTIAEGDPQVTSNVGTVNSLAVTGAGALEISDGGALATTGALTSGGSIVIQTDGTLSIGAAAGFGTARVLDGQVQLDDGGLLQFASGQIATIAGDGALTLDATSFLADAGGTGSNSALAGLSAIAGSLTLNNGASITTTGPVSVSGTLTLQGGGTFTTGGALTNMATGAINLTGGGTATPATLIVDAPAQLGATAGVLDGQVTLDGNAVIQFASGQISTIAADGNLTLSGTDNFIADAGATTSSSALAGFADNAGTLSLEGGASLATTTALTNSGTLDLYQTSTLTTGALANSGTLAFAGGTYTVNGTLTNSGFIGLNINAALVENQPSSLIVDATAGFGTAGMVEGQVDLEGNALVQFSGGQITGIAKGASLTLGDSTAYVADAGAASSNSALVGLADNAGTLTLENGTTLTTSGPFTNAATGTIDLTNVFENAASPILDINSAAGFGTAGVLDGTVEIGRITGGSDSNGALLEFSTGQITSIAADGSLSITGPNSFVADTGATASNSALALASNAGSLSLTDASVTAPGALSNKGTINLAGYNSAANLTINSAAGFGTAGVLTGSVNLTGNSQLTFAGGGEITRIAAGSSLSLEGSKASVADAGGSGTNSALTGLTENDGTFYIANNAVAASTGTSSNAVSTDSAEAASTSSASGGSETLTGLEFAAEIINRGGVGIASAKDDGFFDGYIPITNFGFSLLFGPPPSTIKGSAAQDAVAESTADSASAPALDNIGSLRIGNFQLASSGGVMVNGTLANTGTISVTGTEPAFSGGTPNIAVLDVTTAAGFGTTGVVTGQVNLAGYSLVEFASGQITSIAANSGLAIEGAHAFVADSGAETYADAMAVNSDSALALTSNAGTLALSDGAATTVAAGTTLANAGTIYVDAAVDPNSNGQGGSTLTISGTLSSSGTIVVGTGVATGTGSGTTLNGAGVLALTGGTATVNAGATVSLAEIQIAGPATLDLAGGTTSSPIAFTPGAGGTLEINSGVLPSTGGTFAGQITGFSAGDTIDLTGLAYAGNPLPIYNGATLSVTEGGVTDTLTVAASGLPLFTATQDATGGTEITIVCFASGTAIRTVRGDVAVECLAVGDVAVTASGVRRPIRWLGHRTIDCRRHPRPSEAMPVRVAAHAFGAGRPARDLRVSPGHSICVDAMGEVLVPASALVNGATIVVEDVESVTYWHVELDGHDVILAENLPCESYLAMGNRGFFVEEGVVAFAAGPDAATATHADFCRPFVDGGPVLAAVRVRLSASAPRQARRVAPGRAEAAA